MANDVKPRGYHSPRRRAQADATRRSMLVAAERLFEDFGYPATSVPSIAREAGVALKTVYAVFGTKANLLRDLWYERLAGDESELDVTERVWFRETITEPDPLRQLRLLASHSVGAKTRAGRLMEIIRNAVASDREIALLWNEIESKLLRVETLIVEMLSTRGHLKKGLKIDEARDIAWTLNHPSVWYLMVISRGWNPQRYERWLGDSLIAQLLDVE